jgi:hypothetical protein
MGTLPTPTATLLPIEMMPSGIDGQKTAARTFSRSRWDDAEKNLSLLLLLQVGVDIIKLRL